MADKAIHARLTVHDYDTMSKAERKLLKAWLRARLTDFEDDEKYPPESYSRRFTARLFK